MVSVQPVINPLSQAATFIILTINSGKESQIRDVIEDFTSIVKAVNFRVPQDNLHAILGIGAQAWHKLSFGPKPPHLQAFPEIKGEKHHAPSTPGDLLLHIRSGSQGSAFELAQYILNRFADTVKIVDKVDGFLYFDQRDLLGFVDGTENPIGDNAIKTVFLGPSHPFAGGSYVFVQKYLHNMNAWNKLSIQEQEKVIGRTKLENIELDDDSKPKNSHVALNSLDDGSEIYRANMPFGDIATQELGTYYIAYAANPSTIEKMLTHMFIGNPPGNTDRILDFSTAITGTEFFVPSSDFLDSLPSID